MNKWLSNKEIIQLFEERQKYRVVCKCGHTNYIANKSGRCLCSHCNEWVFKDKKTEFEYRLLENYMKEKRNLYERG